MNMKIVNKIAKADSSFRQRIYDLPTSIQLIIAFASLLSAFQFSFITVGTKKDELKKVAGSLYSYECTRNVKGSDTVFLDTSIADGIVQFSGWINCSSISAAVTPPVEVLYYLKQTENLFNNEYSYHIEAIDILETGQKFIYPETGIGEREVFNSYGLIIPMYFLLLSCMSIYKRHFYYKETEVDKK
ncbi:MAG TPA: hypothetical protein DF774_12385 [Rheinheimera sp.]|uniref:hypothetical protein n=1 Tax=Rheinheimera sp. TaxID=1869214 RepID=UPI000EE2AFA0|nr:hypothetical protein [Rheinheimera sp.]HCU66545.1 hypothetical protein [Rheinheimera sp.]